MPLRSELVRFGSELALVRPSHLMLWRSARPDLTVPSPLQSMAGNDFSLSCVLAVRFWRIENLSPSCVFRTTGR
jgi:hypothetical protein